MIVSDIHQLIGNTPLLLLDQEKTWLKKFNIYAKLEYMNPFGSVKDRLAMWLLYPHIETIKTNNMTVLESSSGNTAKAIGALCSMHDIPFQTITNRLHGIETKKLLQILWIDVTEVSWYWECPDITDPDSPPAQVQKLWQDHPDKYFLTGQYTSKNNPWYHYKTTWQEIHHDLWSVEYFFAFLWTCWSSFWAWSYLKEHAGTKTIGIVSYEWQIIPWWRTEIETWETSIFQFDFYDDIAKVSIDQAVQWSIDLIRKYGVLAWPTSWWNYAATIDYCRKLEEAWHPWWNVVFIACDRFERYVSYYEKYAPWIFSDDASNQENNWEYQTITPAYITKQQLETIKEPTLLIDTRATFAYQRKHIPGSINIPLETLDDLIGQWAFLPSDKKIVLCCRWWYSSTKQCKQLIYSWYDTYILRWWLKERFA